MVQGKLTRKELKKDRIRSYLVDAYDWLAENSKFLAGGLAAIALLLVATFVWETYQESRQSDLQTSFARALEILHAPLNSEVAPEANAPPKFQFASEQERSQKALEEFRKISEEYSGTHIGQMSSYYVAIIQRRIGQTQEAGDSLRLLISEASQSELRAMARDQLASILASQGKNTEAVDLWKAILDDSSSRFPVSHVLMRLGRTYDSMGDQKSALDQYRRLRAEFPDSADTRQVQSRLEYLEEKYGTEEPEASSETEPS